MSAALALPLPGSTPPTPERRIKWSMDDKGKWIRLLVLRIGTFEFVIGPIADPDFTPPSPEEIAAELEKENAHG